MRAWTPIPQRILWGVKALNARGDMAALPLEQQEPELEWLEEVVVVVSVLPRDQGRFFFLLPPLSFSSCLPWPVTGIDEQISGELLIARPSNQKLADMHSCRTGFSKWPATGRRTTERRRR